MPRIGGVNLVACIAGTVAFYAVGMVIYGFALMEVWANETLKNHGLLALDAAPLTGEALYAQLGAIPGSMDAGMAYGLGFLLTLITVFGIAFVLKLSKAPSLVSALGVALVLWVSFGAMTLSYNVLYSTESKIIYGIDLMHLFLGYLLAAAVIYLIDGKAI
ncbi:unnamed protein product, partial [Phaeothamnion confervicola]